MNVTGTVTLSGGQIDIDIINTIVKGTEFTIINNDSDDPVIGIFAGYPEGSTIDNGYDEYSITYRGGDGNDVVLTALTDVRVVLNTDDGGVNSLPGEMAAANTIADPVAVIFKIPGDGPHTISPGSALPDPTGMTFIDATTQNTYAGVPLVEVEGSLAGVGDGFTFGVGTDGSLLRGLVINRWSEDGVQIDGADDILIGANYIGTDTTGLLDLGNGESGVDVVNSFESAIGGPELVNRNLISGNDEYGIAIQDGAARINIEGNWIGIDSSGDGDLGNTRAGVSIEGSGANAPSEIFVGQVGGAANVISGNDGEGVLVSGAGVTGNQIVNNLIGLNAVGDDAVANGREGILVRGGASATTIGLAGAGNTIAGTSDPFAGVSIQSGENTVSGNRIGTDVSGTVTLGGFRGIELATTGNLIGGTSFGDGNTIRGMDVEGIDAPFGNTLLGNSIFDSGNTAAALGIDLGVDGFSATNVPVIELAVSGISTTRVGGSLAGLPNTIYRVEVFSSSVVGAGGFGEAENYLGFAEVTTGDAGFADWKFSTPTLVPVGSFLSATATSESEGTSELAASVASRASLVVTTTAESGPGSLADAITAANAAGGGDAIEFNIGGVGPHRITLTGDLPLITDRTVIDGRSEPDFAGTPVVEIDGDGVATTGIDTTGFGTEISGLAIGGFTGIGVSIGAGNVLVTGNYIGTRHDGLTANANDIGISTGNALRTVIGGSDPADGNLISGNTTRGIEMDNGSPEGRVQGNIIGLSIDESISIPNGIGVYLGGGAFDVIVGTDGDGRQDFDEGNTIAGNTGRGIHLDGSLNNEIAGNRIGIGSDGATPFANLIGIDIIGGSGNRVGTDGDSVSDPAERNLISGNTQNGVRIDSSTTNQIRGNRIGTNHDGTSAVANGQSGIEIDGGTNNVIGGALVAERNLISGNQDGIVVTGVSSGNEIFGNYIGLNAAGDDVVPNSQSGIELSGAATGNFIGTDGDGVEDALERNVIAGNTAQDVLVSANSNVIAGNLIATDPLGLQSVGVAATRLVVSGTGNRIGTDADGVSDAAERNVVGGSVGVQSSSNTFAGNHVGLGEDGVTLLGTATISPQFTVEGSLHTIGGASPVERNHFMDLVDFDGADNVTFVNNHVGVLPDGVTAVASSYLQLRGGAALNQIGGAGALGNVLSGVLMTGAGTDDNILEGNLIGVTRDGTSGLGVAPVTLEDESAVVVIANQAERNRVGTTTAGNTISSMVAREPDTALIGVLISDEGTDGNFVQGNLIGLNPDGDVSVGNTVGIKIAVEASGNIIGGPGVDEGNVISGNQLSGIAIDHAIGTIVEGNRIGTDLSGRHGISNGGSGIDVVGNSPATVLRGNLISGNSGGGITASGESVSILGNRIGTDIDGHSAIANQGFGVQLVAVGANIGGPGVTDGNLISGNEGPGIEIVDHRGNPSLIEGNLIGVDVSEADGLPNQHGVRLVRSSAVIRGNTISGNTENGILIEGNGVGEFAGVIEGNIIGLDSTGTIDFGSNGANGIEIINSPRNVVGGLTAAARNIISGNDQNGIVVRGAGSVDNQILGNFIGTDFTGTVDLGNTLSGVLVDSEASSTLIGIDAADQLSPNVIGGNDASGVTIRSAAAAHLTGNFIGISAGGIAPLPNQEHGVLVESSTDVTVGATEGGSVDGFGNIIANNLGNGIRVSGDGIHRFGANEIHLNGDLGIFVAGPNPGEPIGPIQLQSAPVIDIARAGSLTRVNGTITGPVNAEIEIQLFASDTPDPSGFGEGQRYLDSFFVDTDAIGAAVFSNRLVDAATVGGEFVTATAISSRGTSEFSNAFQASAAAPPTIVQDSLLVTRVVDEEEEATWGIPSQVFDEGEELHLTGDFADVDSNPQVTIDWGDGTRTTDPFIRQESFSTRKVYGDDDPSGSPSDTYAVLVRVTDLDGSGSAFIPITIRNVDPVVQDSGLDQTNLLEGDAVTLRGEFLDPGTGDFHFLNVDWGDGTGNEKIRLPRGDRSFAVNHRYADDGDYSIRYSLFDDDRDPELPSPGDVGFFYDFDSRVRVANAAPTAQIIVPESVVQGDVVSLVADANDSGANDTLSYRWLVVRDGETVFDSDSPDPSFTPHSVGTHEVFLTVRDDEDASATASAQFEVENAAPSILPTDVFFRQGGASIDFAVEGQTISLSGRFEDPGTEETHVVTVDFGDGSDHEVYTVEFGERSFSGIEHTYVDDPDGPNDSFLIKVAVDDGTDQTEITVPFTVLNADPIVSIATDRITEETVRLVADIQDPGINDTHTLEWFVDGIQVAGSRLLSIPRPASSVVDVLFRAIDNDGGVDQTTATLLVLDDRDNDVDVFTSPNGQVNVTIDTTSTLAIPPRDQILLATEGGDDNVDVDSSVTADLQVNAGAGNDTVVTAAGDDTLIGGPGTDLLRAGDGDDVLISIEGDDELDGGLGDDEFHVVSFSHKTYRDLGGRDTLNFEAVESGGGIANGITIDLSVQQTAQQVHSTGTIALFGDFENVVGSSHNDRVTGTLSDNQLYGGPGSDSLLSGGGDDTISGGEDDDTIYGGPGSDSLDGGTGDDTIVDSGGDSDDTIYGGPGSDSILGTGGDDTIIGGEGDDTIYGGPGSESIEGGTGDDTIVDGSGEGDDTIYGGPGSDSILGGDGDDTIIGGDDNDTIFGGSGSQQLVGGLGRDVIVSGDGAGDIIYGGPGSDSLSGGGGDDTILGGQDDDTIYGGPGSESIEGGTGNDTIVDGVGDSDDTIYGGPGSDSILGTGGDDTIVGGPDDDTIYGGPGSDSIEGGTGDDTIVDSGGDSNDTIYGGPGSDSILGTGGDDTISGGEGDDTIYGGPGSESLDGGSGDDTIVDSGGDSDDTIYGGPGSDSIQGTGGDDTILGGPDDDTIYGGPGSDSIDGGTGDDTIVDSGGNSNDTIYGGPGSDSIQGTGGDDTLVGGPDDDTIYGGPGSDSIDGGSGDDTIVDSGGDSDDTIYGGPGSDSIEGTGGDDTILGGEGDDTIYGGPGSDSIEGGAGDDTIVDSGGDSSDTIYGGPGSDSIEGTGGNDTILGGDDDDTIYGGPGSDSIEGGAGNDTIVDSGGDSDDTIYGGPGSDSILGTGGDDTIVGGPDDDTIYGGPGNESIDGGSGDDTIVDGTGSDDIIQGGSGDDSVIGADGKDVITGGDGDDTIVGGLGVQELIDGGSGNDFLASGGGTDDTLVGAAGGDVLIPDGLAVKLFGDTATNSQPTSDDRVLIELDADITLATSGGESTLLVNGNVIAVLSDVSQAILTGGSSANILDASAFLGDAVLIGLAGDDTLIGGVGNDTLIGGLGDDVLSGGGGDDTYTFAGQQNLGNDVVNEAPAVSNDELDFFGLMAPINVNLFTTTPQTIAAGLLELQLSSGDAIERVTGTAFGDKIRGNTRDNHLVGGGGLDAVIGFAGDDFLSATRTRTVFLDFDSETSDTDLIYTQSIRDGIQSRMEQDFAEFDVTITQTRPIGSAFVTALFNSKSLHRGVPISGGSAERIGFRDLERGGLVRIDVNDFLGSGINRLPANAYNATALSSTIASHELGHMFGLRHHDAFGSPGTGIYSEVRSQRLLPAFPGPRDADETADHLTASPASVRTTLSDALDDPYFGERESLKLAYFETGEAINEDENSQKAILEPFAYPIQTLGALPPVRVPNTLTRPAAQNYGVTLHANAISVVGSIDLDGQRAESDLYSFFGNQGDVVTIEVMSQSLRSRQADTFDSVLRLYNAEGEIVDYYASALGALNDDGLEPTDSILMDVILPATGTYVVEVDSFSYHATTELSQYLPNLDPVAICAAFPSLLACTDQETGDYELLLYGFGSGSDSAMGDTVVGGAGSDTLIGSSGNDFFLTDDDDSFGGPGQPEQLVKNTRPTLFPIQNQSVDESEVLNFVAQGFDEDPGDQLTYSLSPAPGFESEFSSATIDAETGVFTWIPEQHGVFDVVVAVTDLHDQTASQTVSIDVRNIDVEASIDSVIGDLLEGSDIRISGSADDPTGAATTISLNLEVSRDGQLIAQNTGVDTVSMLFMPPDEGDYELVLTAIGDNGEKHTARQTITVLNVTPSLDVGPDEVLPASANGQFARYVTFDDPGMDEWSGTVDFDDGLGLRPLAIDPALRSFELRNTFPIAGTYTVRVAVDDGDGPLATSSFRLEVQSPPVAKDDVASVDEDSSTIIDVLNNDLNVDPGTLTLEIATEPSYGIAEVTANNTISYLPNSDYFGSDNFQYAIIDDDGGSVIANVEVSVLPITDAFDDFAELDQAAFVNIDVLANDRFTGPATVTSTTQGRHGDVSINADGSLRYSPNTSFSGTDSFTYSVTEDDGAIETASVTVTGELVQPAVNVGMTGPLGIGPEHHVAAEASLPYTIRFENDSVNARLPVQEMIISQSLDDDLDLTSFRFGEIGFGSTRVEVPEENLDYQTRVDLSSTLGIEVDLSATLDVVRREVRWSFVSIDPQNNLPVTDPLVGFLPPNGNGGDAEGFVSYTVGASDEAPSGARVDAQASLVVSGNQSGLVSSSPIYNTLDSETPVSQVDSITHLSDTSFRVSWSGQDETGGSGIANFDILVSSNGEPYSTWLSATTLTDAVFSGERGKTYSFYSVASDRTGHAEDAPPSADASIGFLGTTIESIDAPLTSESGQASRFRVALDNRPSGMVTIPVVSSDRTEGIPTVESLTFSPENWNIPQTLTVIGVDDFADDGNQTYQIEFGPVSLSDPSFVLFDPPNLDLVNQDDDTADIVVAPTSGLATSENLDTDQFTVVLASQPSSTVSIQVASTDESEGVPELSTLVFTPLNWNVLQSVRVNGQDDSATDGDIRYQIELETSSSDPLYDQISPIFVDAINADNDSSLGVVDVTIQNGEAQRSYINTIDVAFNDNGALQELINRNGIRIERFSIDATDVTAGTGELVSPAMLDLQANSILLGFGPEGIGGAGQSGNGFYRLSIDINGDGLFDDFTHHFFRLYGDADGNGSVNSSDLRVRADLDGNGRFDVRDRRVARNQLEQAVDLALLALIGS